MQATSNSLGVAMLITAKQHANKVEIMAFMKKHDA